MKYLPFIALIISMMACQPGQRKDADQSMITQPDHHSEQLSKIFAAHGGYALWREMQLMRFQLANGEKHTVSLWDRRDKVVGETRSLGFDGQQLWIYPDSLEINDAMFYHNLYFYFAAMPFVVGDEGAYYEHLGMRELDGKNYEGVKVSFGSGIGVSDLDSYILWYDPSTGAMEWLMYTATFGADEPKDQYSLIHYAEWEDVNGLKMPSKIQWHVFEEDSVGASKGEAVFADWSLSRGAPADHLLNIPKGAKVLPIVVE